VSDREHRRQIEVALASAIKRGIVVTIPRRGSRLRYFARPIVVEPEREIIVDEIVPPPKPMRKLAPPAPKPRPGRPRKPDVVKQLPAVVPPPAPPALSLPADIVRGLTGSPAALALLSWLKLEHPDAAAVFDVRTRDIAVRLDWAVPRVVSALMVLVRREVIFDRHIESNHLDGLFAWRESKHRWLHKSARDRASAVSAI
jgi:hypothetical protein